MKRTQNNTAPNDVTVKIPVGAITLLGDLHYPTKIPAVVVFAHGSGSSRLSSRNRFVASTLNEAGMGSLLFDLLTPQEEVRDEITTEYRFNIKLLAQRLMLVSDWLLKNTQTSVWKIGYFGASTGAAAALIAAAELPQHVSAVVSRGGRPDMAGNALPRVKAPTLLIVGGNDTEVIRLNEQAYAVLKSEKKLEIVPGATHLFEEPGTMDVAAKLARDWFINHF